MTTRIRGPVAASTTHVSSAPVGATGQVFHREGRSSAGRKIDYAVGFLPPSGKRVLGERGLAQLNELLALPAHWDGHRAQPVSDVAARRAMETLFAVANDAVLAPQIVPLPDGGVQLEWLAGGFSVEIEVDVYGSTHFLATNAAGEVVVDEEAATCRVEDLTGLTKILLERLTDSVRSSR